ncbi:1-(5-phosphoribosyl)-5-[(5-phosphoribosylamino)methylideneamino]imidazole-4-carboxamide isomerase [Candidatus Bathyarchaeota archaeon]|nr:1-(5-phosphoribosyl)-5-[(5-phosphoribosylamino)methylideneamino]imidazole-4-carboxamide isomerase [Candidatus Bathyarchaeota archaeon]
MLVIPAVDIMNGKCVRLVCGEPSKLRVYYNDPLEAAEKWVEEGAELLHVVDLDAALGRGENTDVIKRIVENVPIKVQLGGGLRTFEKAKRLLKTGVFRVIFGTNLLLNPEAVLETVRDFGSERVAVSLDLKNGKIMVKGWKESIKADFLEMARFAEETLKVGMIIFTSVNRDGTLKGPSLQHAERLLKTVKLPVIVSGGISSLSDLVRLNKMGVYGAIVGTTLYEGKFSLKKAIEAMKNAG